MQRFNISRSVFTITATIYFAVSLFNINSPEKYHHYQVMMMLHLIMAVVPDAIAERVGAGGGRR